MRRHGTILVVAVCLLAVVVAIAYAAGKDAAPEVIGAQVIRAQRFELVDGQGLVWAVLKFGGPDTLPALEMYDANGHTRLALLLGGFGPGLDLMHKNGRVGVAVRVHDGIGDADGEANLVLIYEGDGTRAGVHAGDGGARLELRDDRGKTIWSRP